MKSIDRRTQTIVKTEHEVGNLHLLDVSADTALDFAVPDRGRSTFVAARSRTRGNANTVTLSSMDGDEMASQVVLTAERTTTRFVLTSVWL